MLIDNLRCDCGSRAFIKRMSARGVWEQLIDSGDVVDTMLEGMAYTEPKTVRCADCGKRIDNPDWTP